MKDERTPHQQARGEWIRSYSAASAALARAARTQAAHVAAQNDGSEKLQQLIAGRAREKAADALEHACEELRNAALKLHGFESCAPG